LVVLVGQELAQVLEQLQAMRLVQLLVALEDFLEDFCQVQITTPLRPHRLEQLTADWRA
jgi:hypothetical protein